MLQDIRLTIFEPKLFFNKRDIKFHDRDILTRMQGSFHCMYTIPNSILPRFQSRVILTTDQIAIVTSRYDDGSIFTLSNLEDVEIEQDFLRMYTGDITIEVELGTSEGGSFAEIVRDSWRDMNDNYISEDLSEKEAEHVEEQIESFREREQNEETN